MAVRFSADGQDYSSTSAPPINNYTVTGWFYQAANRGTFQTVWSSDAGANSNFQILQTIESGSSIVMAANQVDTSPAIALSLNTWYRFYVTRSGATCQLYVAAATSATYTLSQATNWPNPTPTTFYVGESGWTGEWWNGRVANLKVFSAVLTQAEADYELWTYQPGRTDVLTRWHPFLTAETVDYSGNARTLSGGAGATTEDGPPIRWGRARGPRVKISAAPAEPIVVDLGAVTEISTTQGLTVAKASDLVVATTTDIAQATTRAKAADLLRAATADSAQAVTRAKARDLLRATESGVSSSVTSAKTRDLGQVTGFDTPGAITRAKAKDLLRASETATAGQITKAVTADLGRATTQATAQVTVTTRTLDLGHSTSTGLAQGITRAKAADLLGFTESSTSALVVPAKYADLGKPTEQDTVGAVTVGMGQTITMGTATETSSAASMTVARAVSLVPAGEASTAAAETTAKASQLTGTAETDTAGLVTTGKAVDLARSQDQSLSVIATVAKSADIGRVSVTEAPNPLDATKAASLGGITEHGSTQGLTVGQGDTITIGGVTETSVVQSLTNYKAVILTPASETGAVSSNTLQHAIDCAGTTEAEQAQPVVRSKAVNLTDPIYEYSIVRPVETAAVQYVDLGMAVETDLVDPVLASKAVSISPCAETSFLQGVTRARLVDLLQSTDLETGHAVTVAYAVEVGGANDISLIGAIAAGRTFDLGSVTETGLARLVSTNEIVVLLGRATETSLVGDASFREIYGSLLVDGPKYKIWLYAENPVTVTHDIDIMITRRLLVERPEITQLFLVDAPVVKKLIG